MENNLEQYKHGRFGFLPLTSIVQRFNLRTFNDGQRHFPHMLRIAADVIKSVNYFKFRIVKEKIITLDPATGTARIPIDYVHYSSASRIDKNNRQKPLLYDGDYVTAEEPPRASRCGCKECECDHDGPCSSINASQYQEEDVEVLGEIYKKMIKWRVDPDGSIYQETTEPFPMEGPQGFIVQFRTRHELIEKVTVKKCGCVENTVENKKKCYGICGEPKPLTCNSACVKEKSYYEGKWKIDPKRGIIHVFDCTTDKIVFRYVSNGEDCGTEIMVPEYMVEMIYRGMFFYSIEFRLNISEIAKSRAEKRYNDAIDEVFYFLNPIDLDELAALKHVFYQW